MDKETVVESVYELATKGRFAGEAIELLQDEMRAFGYTESNTNSVIQVLIMENTAADNREYAETAYETLSNQNNVNKLHGLPFHATCLLLCSVKSR